MYFYRMTREQVYAIHHFDIDSRDTAFYVKPLRQHVKQHPFTRLPHKHDFYFTMLVTKGSGQHEIDFVNYPVEPGSVFMMRPGQMHWWELSKDIDGFVFFHSKEYFEEGYIQLRLNRFDFFHSFQSEPYLKLTKKSMADLAFYFQQMLAENQARKQFKHEKLRALLHLLYVDLSRLYATNKTKKSSRYQDLFGTFEMLIDKEYRSHRLPSYYASELSITEKHLNRICRECINKTSSQLIASRVLLEAKRLLIQTKLNVTQIGETLGFRDSSYFVRFFKKHTSITPLLFQKKYL